MKQYVFIGEREFSVDLGFVGEHRDLADISQSRTNIMDETGIPLSSDRNSPPEDLDFQYISCPYSESFSRYPDGAPSLTPMSGLEQKRLTQSYPLIRRQLLATRAAYLALFGYGNDHQLSTEDGVNVLCIMQGLPTYLTERAKRTVPAVGVLPQHLIIATNCASGAISAVGIFADGRVNDSIKLPDGASLLESAEHGPTGGLVGEKTVCAAPPHMIRQFLNLLKEGSDRISYGTVEDETNGLLETDEILPSLLVGRSMESILVYSENLKMADYDLSQALNSFNPKKQSMRRLRTPLNKFEQAMRNCLNGFASLSSDVNIGLGRAATRSGEFDNFFEKNNLGLRSIRIARAKGVEIHAPSPAVRTSATG